MRTKYNCGNTPEVGDIICWEKATEDRLLVEKIDKHTIGCNGSYIVLHIVNLRNTIAYCNQPFVYNLISRQT